MEEKKKITVTKKIDIDDYFDISKHSKYSGAKAVVGTITIAVLVWMFYIAFTVGVNWWQLLVTIFVTIFNAALVCAADELEMQDRLNDLIDELSKHVDVPDDIEIIRSNDLEDDGTKTTDND